MTKKVNFEKLDGSKLRVGIVYARWNNEVVEPMLKDAKQALLDCGLEEKNIIELDTPGAYELPFGAQQLIRQKADAVICLGALIKGETMHFEYIAEAVSRGIMDLSLKTNTPIVFGVLTCLNAEQARARSVGNKNHAYDWGLTAVEMALKRKN